MTGMTDERAKEIAEALNQGKQVREIADTLGVSSRDITEINKALKQGAFEELLIELREKSKKPSSPRQVRAVTKTRQTVEGKIVDRAEKETVRAYYYGMWIIENVENIADKLGVDTTDFILDCMAFTVSNRDKVEELARENRTMKADIKKLLFLLGSEGERIRKLNELKSVMLIHAKCKQPLPPEISQTYRDVLLGG